MPRKFQFHDAKRGAAITVVVVPGAEEDRVARILKDGTIKVHLKTPQQAADLNHSIISFISRVLGVPSVGIEIVAGLDGMEKIVAITDLDAETVNHRIKIQIQEAKAG